MPLLSLTDIFPCPFVMAIILFSLCYCFSYQEPYFLSSITLTYKRFCSVPISHTQHSISTSDYNTLGISSQRTDYILSCHMSLQLTVIPKLVHAVVLVRKAITTSGQETRSRVEIGLPLRSAFKDRVHTTGTNHWLCELKPAQAHLLKADKIQLGEFLILASCLTSYLAFYYTPYRGGL